MTCTRCDPVLALRLRRLWRLRLRRCPPLPERQRAPAGRRRCSGGASRKRARLTRSAALLFIPPQKRSASVDDLDLEYCPARRNRSDPKAGCPLCRTESLRFPGHTLANGGHGTATQCGRYFGGIHWVPSITLAQELRTLRCPERKPFSFYGRTFSNQVVSGSLLNQS